MQNSMPLEAMPLDDLLREVMLEGMPVDDVLRKEAGWEARYWQEHGARCLLQQQLETVQRDFATAREENAILLAQRAQLHGLAAGHG